MGRNLLRGLFSGLVLVAISASLQKAGGEEVYGPPLPPALNKPVFSCPSDNYNWGEALEGEVLKHTFKVINKGGSTLKLLKVLTSCGCQTVDYTKEIPPQGDGKITVNLQTRGYGGRNIKKSIRVVTNDPGTSRKRLYMYGSVKEVVKIEPKYPELKGLRGEALHASVTITSNLPEKVKILSVSGGGRYRIKHEVSEITPGKKYKLDLEVKTTANSSRFSYGRLNLNLQAGKKMLKKQLRVKVRLVETINPSHRYLTFRQNELRSFLQHPNSRPRKTVVLKSWKEEPFRVTNLKVRRRITSRRSRSQKQFPPLVEAQVENEEEKPSHTVIVALTDEVREVERPARYVRYEVVISTDDKMTKKISLPVTLYFPRKGAKVSSKTHRPARRESAKTAGAAGRSSNLKQERESAQRQPLRQRSPAKSRFSPKSTPQGSSEK